MNVKSEIKQAIHKLGYNKLKKQQVNAVKSLLSGNDTIVIAGTGFGKTAIYMTAGMVMNNRLTIVVEPLLSLIYNQVERAKQCGINADYIDSTRTKEEVNTIMKNIQKLNFLYVTPERLQSRQFISNIKKTDVGMIVIDECHCVTEYGSTFRESYLKIGDFINKLDKRPVICACSATILDDSLKKIQKSLSMNKPNIIKCDLSRKNLVLIKKNVTANSKNIEKRLIYKLKMVVKMIKKYHTSGSVVIYALTPDMVDAIYYALDDIYPDNVVRYHSKIEPKTYKNQMQIDFLTGNKKIMVATSAFGMGIDANDIELVVHFNAPMSMTDYIQQIGRAGRDGRTAHCVLFYEQNGDDKKIIKALIKKHDKAKSIIKSNFDKVNEYISSSNCMHLDLLKYQGQTEHISCKKCTNCAKNRRKGNNNED